MKGETSELKESMRITTVPFSAIFIGGLTLAYSMYVAFTLTGNVLGNVKIVQLESYGGVTFSHLNNLEIWRLFASQLIHAKQLHMLYNVSCIVLLGLCLARQVSNVKFFLVWFASGVAGTLASTLFSEPPWNLGTGASQAVIGIAAFGLVLSHRQIIASKLVVVVLCFSIVPTVILDFMYAGYPKPGHVVGALVGVLAGVVHSQNYIKSEP
jgi:rhomboid protease GluP